MSKIVTTSACYAVDFKGVKVEECRGPQQEKLTSSDVISMESIIINFFQRFFNQTEILNKLDGKKSFRFARLFVSCFFVILM